MILAFPFFCCMPCPIDIDSPGIAALYNEYMMYGNDNVPLFLYVVRGFGKTLCGSCEICTRKCPRRYKGTSKNSKLCVTPFGKMLALCKLRFCLSRKS
jgi:hypothetical protein